MPATSAEKPRGALVTGGARGIGRAVAETLAQRGDDVIVADLDAVAARACAAALTAGGCSARAVELDVADVDMVREVVAAVAALRAMVLRRHGSVVNVSSTSGFTASTGPMAVYDTSKAGVRMLTQAAAREVAALGVRVNAVAPGTLETDLTLGLASSEELAALAAERVPLGRLGRPEEIAVAVAFLSSDAASYITGHVLVADGGWLA